MPQIRPLNWLLLNFFSIFTLFLIITLIYFSYYNNFLKKAKKSTPLKKFNFKW